MKITTTSINNRSDWYQAHSIFNGRHYNAFEKTRHGAFCAVLRQLFNATHSL